MSCRTGCRTQDHATWGDCARAMNLQVGALQGSDAVSRRTDKRLGAYKAARDVGLQPPSTKVDDSLATLRAAGA